MDEQKKFKIIVKDCKSKDGKKEFKTYKLVDEDNNKKLVDCVMCKSIDPAMKAELDKHHKAYVIGDIEINNNAYEYPKAFIRQITNVEKV